MASGERKKIGKYEVLDILGRGGMGIVYKAVDPGIGRAVAIKMTTGAVGEDPEMLQRFSREAQSVGQLQHPNIVTVYDLGVEGRNPYLVMELLEGESLEALERSRRSLSLEEKLDITMQICAGVQYAHRRGVMHRDIKPANIMILKDGTAKIVDFGIARMGMQKLTRPGQLVGSFAYMSPEQINAAPVDARTDIFSIGVLLFELVAGRLPFEGKDTGEMLLKILHQAPPSLRELAPDCPAELEGMVQRALAKNVEERYQSAEDLGFDLGHVLEKWRRERVSEYLAGAETAAAQRQWGRAKEQLLQVLKRDRQNSRANLRLREVQQEMQKQQRGERARELQAQAEHALAQADVVEALRYLNEAVELDGGGNPEIVQFRDSIQQQKTREDQLHALRQRAEMAQDAGDLEAARQAVEDGLALDGKNTDFRALQVAITRELAGRDQQKRVQEFLGEARKQISSRRFTAALEALRQAEALDPTVPVVRELIVLASTGQRQERRRLELEALTARIEEALVKEDYGTAAARIDQGLRSYPEDRGLLKLQAVVNKQREETEKRAYLERQTAQARRLLDGGQGAEALTVLRAALAKYPGEASLEALLAMVEESIERARKEQETREVIQSARQALRRKAYAIAIAILEEARKKRPSSEYDELLQFAQNEAENQARRQKIDAVAEAARRLTAEDKYPEAMALLQATVQEIPDQELQIILADIKRHVDEFQAGVEKALATAERLLRQDRYAEAIKLLESQSAQYGNAPRLQQTLAAIRQRQQTVHAVSVLKEEVRNALAQADTAAAQRLCQQFRQSDQATETALVEIALLEKEIAAQQTEAANRQLEMALRDARLLVTVHSPQAALSVLETVASALPFAALELQQRFQALQTAARNTQPSLTPPSSPVAVSTTAHSTPPHSTAPISTTAISTAPISTTAIPTTAISTTAIPTEDDSEETQLADPDRLQSMLLEVAQIAGNYRHHTKLQSEIYSLKQQLTEKISILRESQLLQSAAEIADAKRTRPQLFEPTATSLKSVEPENTSAGGLQPAALPCEPPAPEPAEKLFATVAERDAAATSAPPADSLAVNRPLQSSNTAEPPAPQFPAESLPVPPANDSRRPPTGERIPQRMQPASFFVVGGTLRRDALSYIERAADETLYRALQAGEICYVLTARQMGKSSLMVRTAARLRESSARVAVLDLTGLGQNLTAEQWYNGLIERAGQQFNLEDEVDNCWRRFPQLGPMRRFMRVLSDVILPVAEDRIVIFIDEIDAVRSLSFSTDEFFAGIRECFNRRSSEPSIERLTFCLLGVATPSDLIRDTRTTPFNIGRRIELTDFTEHEAMPLAQGLGADDSAGSAIVRRVIYWTNGHPYLTQRLCQAVAQEKTRNPSTVDRLCQELFLSSRARDRDDNLLFVRERILRSEVDKAGLLTLYARILDGKAVRDEETNPLISVLRLSGITRVENGLLKVRSRIYKEVFNQDWATSNMPGAEVRRQRAAYKRGIKLALAITLPLLVIGMAVAYWNLYSVRNTIAERRFDTPKPPAFWASSRMPVAGAQSEIGGILLRTGQPDVTVLVDDFSFGRTSSSGDLRIPLPPASYNIRVEKQGFQALKLPVNVLKDQETQLNVKLQREVIVATSFVLTAAVPGAVVRFDGKEVGQVQSDGTFTHEASPGAHTIELDKTGYELFHTQQTFTLGEKSTIEARMQPSAEAAESSDYAAVADSTDPSQLRQFLQKHPNSKNAAQVRNRVEELDWKNVNTTDLASLDAFLQAHSQGQHANEARGLVAGLQKEQEECMVAMNSNNIEQLQSVVTKYPKSAYAEPARQKLSQLRDKVAVLSVMRRYEEAYNRKDLDGIVAVWPSCPYQKAYRDSFRSPEPQKLKLELEEPDIQGIMASVKGTGTRSGALSSSSSFTAKLIKQGDKWIIQSGIY